MRLLGLKRRTLISFWESHHTLPRPETIVRVARALRCEPRELLDDVQTPYDLLRAGVPMVVPDRMPAPAEHDSTSWPSLIRTSPRSKAGAARHGSRGLWDRLATFSCDSTMQLGNIRGLFADRLACEADELLGAGWQQFLYRPSIAVLEQLECDKRALRGGQYDLPFRSREGDRLHVLVRTLALHETAEVRMVGDVHLIDWEPVRRTLDLGA